MKLLEWLRARSSDDDEEERRAAFERRLRDLI